MMRVLSKDTGGPRTLQATFATMCVGKTLNLKGSGYPIRAARTTTGRLDAAFSGWTCSGNGINPAAVILCLVCGLGGPGEKSAFRKLAGRFCELCVDTQSSQCRWGFDSSDLHAEPLRLLKLSRIRAPSSQRYAMLVWELCPPLHDLSPA